MWNYTHLDFGYEDSSDTLFVGGALEGATPLREGVYKIGRPLVGVGGELSTANDRECRRVTNTNGLPKYAETLTPKFVWKAPFSK